MQIARFLAGVSGTNININGGEGYSGKVGKGRKFYIW